MDASVRGWGPAGGDTQEGSWPIQAGLCEGKARPTQLLRAQWLGSVCLCLSASAIIHVNATVCLFRCVCVTSHQIIQGWMASKSMSSVELRLILILRGKTQIDAVDLHRLQLYQCSCFCCSTVAGLFGETVLIQILYNTISSERSRGSIEAACKTDVLPSKGWTWAMHTKTVY